MPDYRTVSTSSADIVLTTLNAKYAHCAFGLRYLLANLDPDLQARTRMVEFDINRRTSDILEVILGSSGKPPRIIGLGVYIWNAQQSLELVADLKRVSPETIVILGGPEVSYETDQQRIIELADYTITGEADLAFNDLCRDLLDGRRKPLMKVIPAELPEMDALRLPYAYYSETDIAHRVIYAEASRGCPFKCEFCLSSLDVPVRMAPIQAFLTEMQNLLDRGAKQFKFVDRTFNLNIKISEAILQFFLDRYFDGLFLHFEMIPDRLPEQLRRIIKQFPPGALQFEVGIQTFNEEVEELISRQQNHERLRDNLHFLRSETGVHVHTDLIVGLPGESIASFARGFDALVALDPQEIQVGMLKRLRGTPIVRHDDAFGMKYSEHAPYEILSTKDVDFATMQQMRRFSRFWDLIANSGNFRETLPVIMSQHESAFESFFVISQWLTQRFGGGTSSIALLRLMEGVWEYLVDECGEAPMAIAQVMWRDYSSGGVRSDRPLFMRQYIEEIEAERDSAQRNGSERKRSIPRRQARHLS